MAVPVVQSYSGTSTSTGTVTVTAPTGIVNDDFLVMVASTDWAAAGTATYTPPTGVTELFPFQRANDVGAGVSYQAWYKVASGEPGSYTLTLGSARLTGFSVTRVDGQNLTTPLNGTIGTTVTSGDPIVPGIQTTVDDCLIFHSVTWDESKTLTTAPSGDTLVGSIDVSGHDQWAHRNSQVTAGSQVPGTYDISAATKYVACTFAIAGPAAGAEAANTNFKTLLGVGNI